MAEAVQDVEIFRASEAVPSRLPGADLCARGGSGPATRSRFKGLRVKGFGICFACCS